jgi:molybdenum cofactor cytidylyltransferase
VTAPARVAAIVLAAGRASRFGTQKLIAPLDGAPMVTWAARAAAHSRAARAIAVLGADAERVRETLAGIAIDIVIADDHASGMSASLRAGLDALRADIDAVVIVLGDQPSVGSAIIDLVIARWEATHASIVQAMYRDGASHPVLFARAMFGELRAVRGDRAGREVLERHRDRIVYVTVDSDAPRDIDTPDDYDRARNAGADLAPRGGQPRR